jgi:hypothetical protein
MLLYGPEAGKSGAERSYSLTIYRGCTELTGARGCKPAERSASRCMGFIRGFCPVVQWVRSSATNLIPTLIPTSSDQLRQA